MEWHDPRESVSTAYALSVAKGELPRWTATAHKMASGVWVSNSPPPGPRWRWLDVRRADCAPSEYDERLADLLRRVNPSDPLVWHCNPRVDYVRAGGIWTNDVMGDWWVDRGISESKRRRLDAFVSWLTNAKPPPQPMVPYKPSSDVVATYGLRLNRGAIEEIVLPVLELKVGSHVYLGRGVSGDVVEVNGKTAIVGSPPYTEGWGVPSVWVLFFPEDFSPKGRGEEKREEP